MTTFNTHHTNMNKAELYARADEFLQQAYAWQETAQHERLVLEDWEASADATDAAQNCFRLARIYGYRASKASE